MTDEQLKEKIDRYHEIIAQCGIDSDQVYIAAHTLLAAMKKYWSDA